MLREVDPSVLNLAYRRTKYLIILDEFLEMGCAVAQVEGSKIYLASLRRAILTYSKTTTIGVKQIQGKIYLINKLKCEELGVKV